MQINVNTELKTLDGQVIPAIDSVTNEQRATTLKDILVRSMMEVPQAEATSMDGNKKMKRYLLAKKVHEASDNVDLEIEELALLREYVGKLFNPIVVGQVWLMLEGK